MNFLHSYVNYHLKVKTKHFLLLELTRFRAFYTLGLILSSEKRNHIQGSQWNTEELASMFRRFGRKKQRRFHSGAKRSLGELISHPSQESVICSRKYINT